MSDEQIWDRRRTSFGSAAKDYAGGRPHYPADALRWGADGAATALDLAAGTGIVTAGLLDLGLAVTAVEPLAEMRALIPADAHVLDGTAEAIPLPDASVDAVFVGQAWHWFEPERALVEMRRVLRPGGSLTLMWNLVDTDDELSRTVADILQAEERTDQMGADDAEPPFDDPTRFTVPTQRLFAHRQRYDADRIVANAQSRSMFILLDPDGQAAMIDALRRAVPAGEFTISWCCEAWRASAVEDRTGPAGRLGTDRYDPRMPRSAAIRTTTAIIAVSAVGVGLALTAPASSAAARHQPALPSTAYRAHDFAHGQAMSILPPGENGAATEGQLLAFKLDGSRPKHSQDQLGKYENLLYGYQNITDSKLGKYYDDESFGVPKNKIIRTEHPSSTKFPSGDVLIERGPNDVPHIYGATNQAGAFGAGYAQAEDRLFLMDVLRHFGAGDLSSFAGPSCADEQMDHDQLLLAPYTQAQGDAQVNALPKEYGKQGLLAKNMIDAYVDGINAWIAQTQAHPGLLDGDYLGVSTPTPAPWTPADVVSVGGLIGGIFGRGGGAEVANSALYTYLQHKLGNKAGAKAFAEFKEQNDPNAPTTVVGKSFPYEGMPAHVKAALTAIPDNPRKPLTGGPTDTTSDCGSSAAVNPQVLADIASLERTPSDMSNALVVDAKDTKAHHPIAVFGPQVSYYSPQILTQEEISTPGYHAEGASFPGTGLVELGRGEDYAWSATSAGTDLIDQRLELICDPDGKKPTATEKFYRYKGKCVAMKHETFDETGYTEPDKGGTAVPISHDIFLTRHGVVQGWTTAKGGKPVAIVNQRSTFNHDIDSVVGFLHWGEPKLTHSVKSWENGAKDVGYTFNWFYVDSKHIAYYVSGKDPVRAKGVNPNLPTWGTGSAEWRGFLPASKHVHQTDPKQGFFVSWNNKPAPGFSAADDQYGYGPSYRSQMLVAQLKHELTVTHHQLTRADVVKAMETAASQDLTGLKVLPQLLAFVKGHKEPKGVASMLKTLAAWHAKGAHRHKASPKAKQYQQHAAIAIMDELEPTLIESIFNRLLAGPGLNGSGSTAGGYSILPMGFVDTPNGNGSRHGSSYDGGWEGYMEKALEQLRGKHPVDPFTSIITKKWCTSGPASCRGAINRALAKTYKTLKKENGTAKVSRWTIDSALIADRTASGDKKETMPQFDAINFTPFGLITQPRIDWQNRPTFQQVIQFPAHRKG